MTIKVLINGASGKMGQAVNHAVLADPLLSLVGGIGSSDDLSLEIKNTTPDVVIDFTTPGAVYNNTLTIIEANVHPVIGTTGFTTDQISDCQQKANEKKLGGLIAPNFSLAAVLMMQCAKTVSQYFPDAEIIEYHHPEKKDAPSGTAIKTRELMMQHAESNGTEQKDIPIHSVRLPGVIANQEIIFGGQNETLSIKHNTLDRTCFMPGVLMACKKVMELDRLCYGLEEIL